MTEPRRLTELQLDALREMGNIGSGHAAASLSTLLGHPVRMDVPAANLSDLGQIGALLGGREAMVWAVYLTVSGDLEGHMALLIREAEARRLVGVLLPNRGAASAMDELAESTLAEIGNILTSAYVGALTQLTGFDLRPSPPLLAHDQAGAVLDSLAAEIHLAGQTIVTLEGRLEVPAIPGCGVLLVFLPPPAILPRMFEALGLDALR
ncbi:MAG: chemotaxis protein CheC [Candidatus Sericytochromatia bacterium]|nr:chemotaxis protein CheC [Candidatus Tanganyikabacteria bacterium]